MGSGGSGGGGAKRSDGCGKMPSTLKSATVGQATPVNTIAVGGANREFLVRWPSDYKNDTPYRLHIGLHGYGGNLAENGRDNFGLWSLSNNSTIFVTLAAVGGGWDLTADVAYANAVLKQIESELCIDTSRVMLEGFSQGGAMAWVLTCSSPGVYRAVVGHSAGSPNFTAPTDCSPVAYLGSLGLSDVAGNSQATQTDRFAKVDGCTIENLPTAPTGGHVCTPYKGCQADFPVTWCSYDGGHGFQPTDAGQSKSWMPAAVWSFLSPL
jgi:poly(3-hydroxybutyrate) depolymerase